MHHVLSKLLLITLLLGGMPGCKRPSDWERGKKIFHAALRSKVGSLDPVRSSTQYAAIAQDQVYETLYSYKYLMRPYELEPLLAIALPKVSEDNLTYTISLRKGVRFQDNQCFEASEGVGRELTAQDVVWSLKRMTDRDLTPSGWWIFQDRIVGFNDFQARMNARKSGAPFDWDGAVEGLQAINRYTLQIRLVRPFPQLMYVLAMGYSAVVPRECAEYYGKEFGNTAVGTGPFVLKTWVRGSRFVYERNPTYREEYYPSEAIPEFEARGLLEPAGRRIPFVDGIVLHVFEQDQPMWLKWRVGDIDLIQVPAEYHDAIFDAHLSLRPAFVEDGVKNVNLPLLDLIYRGFNMEDPVLGGEKGKKIRQAMALAMDTKEFNDAFYNNTAILYDGPIAPGLEGYTPGVISPYRGPNLEKARKLLAEAGYPGGRGLPLIRYDINKSSNSAEQAELLSRQLRAIGVELEVNLNSFPELSDKLKRKKSQFFGLAWGADYPDAENFLQMFYGPNGAPGSNNFNYSNPEFDRLYDLTRTMFPSPERTALYVKMRDLVIEDVPAFASMARIRFYVWNKRIKYVQPTEIWKSWYKYIDVEVTD